MFEYNTFICYLVKERSQTVCFLVYTFLLISVYIYRELEKVARFYWYSDILKLLINKIVNLFWIWGGSSSVKYLKTNYFTNTMNKIMEANMNLLSFLFLLFVEAEI